MDPVTSAADVHSATATEIEAALLAQLTGMPPAIAANLVSLANSVAPAIIAGVLAKYHLVPKS